MIQGVQRQHRIGFRGRSAAVFDVALLLSGVEVKSPSTEEGGTFGVYPGSEIPAGSPVDFPADFAVVVLLRAGNHLPHRGHVIGFERLNYLSKKKKSHGVKIPVEVQML